MCINNVTYRLINIYAPNGEYDRVCFLNKLNDWISQEFENIIGGDFNFTLNSDIDRENCINSSDVGQIDLKKIMSEHDLEDIFRRRYPAEKEFSWRCGEKRSRLDYWLISTSLDNQVVEVNHMTCPFTDHSFVKMSLRTSNV